MYSQSRIYLLILIFAVLGIVACKNKKASKPLPGRVYEGLLFSVPYTIDVVGDSTNYQREIDSIIGIAKYHFDLNDPNSTISRFNKFDRTDTAFCFRDSLKFFGIVYDLTKDIHYRSNQIYDPTTNPLELAWFILRVKGLGGEPNLDSLYKFVGFDGARVDLNEMTAADGFTYKESQMRKADPRILLDLTSIAAAYTLDQIGQLLQSKNVSQYRISSANRVITYGAAVPDLNTVKLGISEDTSDQKIQMINRAFACKTIKDKQNMVDPTYGYPVDNEFLYVGVSARTLVEAEAFSEAFMIMGFDQAASWYDQNENSDVQSFMVIRRGDEITTASTEEFDNMLLVPDSMKVE